MSVYKVPQDVEAEDKLIGPFTFRQFIFLIVAAISLFVTIQLFRVNPALSIISLPPLIIFGVLGVYRRPDQPAEIYLLAVLRFYLKPHVRIWDQEGIIETIHITAPKKVLHQYSDNMSQDEVKGRLDTLAKVMDSRGWAVKNVDINSPLGKGSAMQSDRLVMPTQVVEPTELHAADDMLDVFNNPVARDFEQKIQGSSSQAKQDAMAHMQQATQVISPTPAAQSDDSVAYNPYPSNMHQHVVAPLGAIPTPSGDSSTGPAPAVSQPTQQASQTLPAPAPQAPPATTTTSVNSAADQNASRMTPPPSDAILRLANNSDLRISTLASEAARIEALEDDTTISLH